MTARWVVATMAVRVPDAAGRIVRHAHGDLFWLDPAHPAAVELQAFGSILPAPEHQPVPDVGPTPIPAPRGCTWCRTVKARRTFNQLAAERRAQTATGN